MSLSVVKTRAWSHKQQGRFPQHSSSRLRTRSIVCAAPAAPAVGESTFEPLKASAKRPGAAPGSKLLEKIIDLEKAKLEPTGWEQVISAPTHRWRLIYTAPSKAVTAARKGKPEGKGQYVPIAACQKFDFEEKSFENGIFLGPLFHLTFKGPYAMMGRNLYFDVGTMYIGLGPWRVSIPLKKDCPPVEQRDPKEVKKLPFFVYAYADDDIIVARGRSGGVALWGHADQDWQAKAGVMQVYK